MYRIKGCFQHYEWGGNTFLSELFSIQNPEKKPFAEYWLGVHSGGVAKIEMEDGNQVRMDFLFNSDKSTYLGERTKNCFGNLPFLLKILDVRKMLSIQVHPTKKDAEAGFEKENNAGIPLDAPYRNYKDDNHKPEIMVALSDFWLLHGFAKDLETRLKHFDFLQAFIEPFQNGGIKGLYAAIMNLPQAEVNRHLSQRLEWAKKQYATGKLNKQSPDYWAARACEDFKIKNEYDRGIFSIYLFNIVNLKPGQGIFQGAGMPHAYLEGQNIELMSNSDNVLRGGLTNKHVDVDELMKHIVFDITVPQVLEGALDLPECTYPAPVDDFNLHYCSFKQGEEKQMSFDKPAILLLLNGVVNWQSSEKNFKSNGTDSFFVKPGEKITIQSCSISQLFIATVN